MQADLHLVVGLGKTGLSIARHLHRRGVPFVVYDTRSQCAGAAEFQSECPGIQLALGDFPQNLYDRLKVIICSPGVSLDEPFIQEAQKRAIPVIGDIDCLAKEIDEPVVAITGTNGKSTVTTLVGEMAKAAGKSVAVAGNIGLPALDILDVGVSYDLWVLELSSFQLDLTYALAPKAATVLNITPDHLDRHHTLDAYVQAKHRVYNHAEMILFNRNDPLTRPSEKECKNKRVISYGADAPPTIDAWGLIEEEGETYLVKGEKRILCVSAMKIRGKHNWLNALAACALADAVGVSKKSMTEVLKRFPGLPHRCQWVRTLNQVDWVNDSKATNVGATQSAIVGLGESMPGKIILIAGGKGKDAEFTDLAEPIENYVRSVILIGEDAGKIEAVIPDSVPVQRALSLQQAIERASRQAEPGDVVLMSPACASFDMFRDFNERGDAFMSMVAAL